MIGQMRQLNNYLNCQILTILILLSLIFNLPAWSKEYRPEVGVRALGMAGAFTSRSDDPTATLWNPAGLARLQHGSILVYDLSQGALSFAYPIKQVGTFGLSVLDLNYQDRFIYDRLYNPFGKFEIGYNQITLSYARSVGNYLMIGTNCGYNVVPWENSSWQPSFDAGVITRVKSISVGARITDIADTKFYNRKGQTLKNFYQQVSVGASWAPNKYFSINGDFNADKRKLCVGSEVGWKGVYLRSGVIRNLNNTENPFDWTMGTSINRSSIQLNYGYIDNGLDYKHLISVGIKLFGIGEESSPKPHPEVLATSATNHIPNPIPKILPTTSPVSRPLQVKPAVSEAEIKTDIKEENISASPIKLPVIDNLENNTFPPKTNIELEGIQQDSEMLHPVAESESETAENSEPNKNNAENSETLIMKLTKKHDIELPLILAVIEIESMFNPNNVSAAGAAGLMQLMPVTARELGLRVPRYKNSRKPVLNSRLDERFNPKKNVEAGMKFLSRMIEKYNKNYVLALCAYNAGPGRVDKKVPSIRETEKHVGKVLNRYYEYQNSPEKMRASLEKLNAILGE